MSRFTDLDSRAQPALVGGAGSGVRLRFVVVVGAAVMLLRLMFSERAREELEDAAVQLEAALNEVDARLARMKAERFDHRVRLRVVPSSSPCDVKPNRKAESKRQITTQVEGKE